MPKVPSKYAGMTVLEYLYFIIQVLRLPFILALTLIASPFVPHNQHKTWRRVLADRSFRWLASLSIAQVQAAFGTTIVTYKATIAKLKLSPTVEDIGDNAHLLWLGPKRTDRVLLYLHGGGFVAPLSYVSIYFWRYVQEQLKQGARGFDLGIVILHYSVTPEGTFPTPLRQSVAAIKHLMADGLHLENLHLAGDSAGGNLAIQLLLHTIRPIPSVEPLTLQKPIRGVYLMSPWVRLTADSECHFANSNSDVISQGTLQTFGSVILPDVPESQRDYIEAVKAPDSWFEGLDKVVGRILITAGGQECLRDDIVGLHEKIRKGYRGDLKLVVQKGGVHNDMFMDFLVRESKPREETAAIIQWLAAGYESR